MMTAHELFGSTFPPPNPCEAAPVVAPDRVRVLMVDDDPQEWLLARKMLSAVRGPSIELVGVETGEQAAAALTQKSFDICLIDFWLGSTTGFDVMATLRPLNIDVPIILLTGNPDRAIDLEAERRGAYDYLVKSELTSDTLERSIRYALTRHRLERQLAAVAFYDPLTGLANRRLFEEHLFRAAERVRRQQSRLCLAYIDLNEFKPINDELGHEIGDGVLVEFARVLKQSIRKVDLAARVGGDEFALTFECAGGPKDAEAMLARVQPSLVVEVPVPQNKMRVTASIGLAALPDDCTDMRDLLRISDMAMYQAKQAYRRTGQPAVVWYGSSRSAEGTV